MRSLFIAVIVAAMGSVAMPFANATDGPPINDDVVKLFADAIPGAQRVQPVDPPDTYRPAVVVPLLRVVFTVETFRLLLDAWDHIVANWGFYRNAISSVSGKSWVATCSVESIGSTPVAPEVILRCPTAPASSRSESE